MILDTIEDFWGGVLFRSLCTKSCVYNRFIQYILIIYLTPQASRAFSTTKRSPTRRRYVTIVNCSLVPLASAQSPLVRHSQPKKMAEYRDTKMKPLGDALERLVKESVGKEGFVVGNAVRSGASATPCAVL